MINDTGVNWHTTSGRVISLYDKLSALKNLTNGQLRLLYRA